MLFEVVPALRGAREGYCFDRESGKQVAVGEGEGL